MSELARNMKTRAAAVGQPEAMTAPESATQVLGQCLDAELLDRGLTSPGAQICSDIVQGVFRRYGEALNRRQLTQVEWEEMAKRSV